MAITVTLDAFSGRPNPTWTLSEEEGAALARLLVDLPRSPTAATEDGLGYRGFILENPEHKAGLPARMRVGNGVITVEEDLGPASYQDIHGAERLFAQQATQRGYGALVQHLL